MHIRKVDEGNSKGGWIDWKFQMRNYFTSIKEFCGQVHNEESLKGRLCAFICRMIFLWRLLNFDYMNLDSPLLDSGFEKWPQRKESTIALAITKTSFLKYRNILPRPIWYLGPSTLPALLWTWCKALTLQCSWNRCTTMDTNVWYTVRDITFS